MFKIHRLSQSNKSSKKLTLSVFMAITMTFLSFQIVSAQFSDIQKSSLTSLYEQGMITGYPDGTFKPENTMNRAELLTLILKAKRVPVETPTENCFQDVNFSEWYAPYICTAKAKGWIKGYNDGSFKPSQFINKAEALKIIDKIYAWKAQEENTIEMPFQDVTASDWFLPSVKSAFTQGFIDKADHFYPAAFIKRGEVAEILYRIVQNHLTTQIKTGTSFGMCLGYCFKEWTITPTEIVLVKRGRDIGEGIASKQVAEVTEKASITPEEWKSLMDSLDLEKFNALPDTLGCPDCADGGAEWIEIVNNQTSKKVMCDYNQAIPGIDAFLEKIRALRGKVDSQNG